MDNQKWTIQKNWEHRHKTNKTKTQHSMCWTPLRTNCHPAGVAINVELQYRAEQ